MFSNDAFHKVLHTEPEEPPGGVFTYRSVINAEKADQPSGASGKFPVGLPDLCTDLRRRGQLKYRQLAAKKYIYIL